MYGLVGVGVVGLFPVIFKCLFTKNKITIQGGPLIAACVVGPIAD